MKQLGFTFTGCGFSVPLLGPIASGLVHLKRNKGLGGTYTPFFSFTYREHPSLSRLISLSNTPHNQTLTLLECLAPKEVDSSHSSLATLRYTDLGPCSFVFLSFLKKPWCCMQIAPHSWGDSLGSTALNPCGAAETLDALWRKKNMQPKSLKGCTPEFINTLMRHSVPR